MGKIMIIVSSLILQLLGNEVGNMQDIRQIRILCQETEIIYTLNDSQAATELYNQLPLEVPVENFSHNEKIFYPLESLDTSDAPLASGGSGILAYYAPWQDVVLFYDDFQANSALFALGTCTAGETEIAALHGTIRIEKVVE